MEKKEGAQFVVYAQTAIDEIVEKLGSSLAHGLSAEQVDERVLLYGRNEHKERPVYWWQILFRQVATVFIGLFFVIALFFFVLGEHTNALIVFMLILINVGVGFYQEFKASKTIHLLKKYIQVFATVLRDQKVEEIQAAELVPGDIIMLEAGDIVPADTRIYEELDLVIDESVLTGESAPLKKTSQAIVGETPDLFKAYNIAFAGTTVVKGRAKGIVFGTGDTTTFGAQFNKSYGTWRESILEKGVLQLSTFILKLTFLTLGLTVGANLLLKGAHPTMLVDVILFAVALMVTAIPEALPIVVTFNLSRAVRRLLKMHVIVKRLSAVEDLGALDLLCVDKTGTLTENTLDLVATQTDNEEALLFTMSLTLLSGGVKNVKGFDAALEQYVLKHNEVLLNKIRNDYSYHNNIPFDPTRRRTLLLAEKKDHSGLILVVRGSYEDVAKSCSAIPQKTRVEQWIHDEGIKGRRIIALASRELLHLSPSLLDDEHDLAFVGLLSFVDPVKKTAYEAIKQAKELGVSIKVISGDAPEVCGAVAFELGLIDNPQSVVTGAQLANIAEIDRDAFIETTVVFSRVLPDQKAAIIQSLQIKHTVGYLGDGINDLAALSVANVALVVQGCADVVRESGDIILTKKSLMAIIHGIREGRIILANTMKYIKTTISANFGNFYAVAIASLFVTFMPMLPIQILLLNFLSDFPMIALATDTVDAYELSKPKRYDINSILFIAIILGIVSTIFDFSCFAYFWRFSPATLQTGWFIESVLTEIVFIFSVRSIVPFYKAQRPSFILMGCGLFAALLTIVLPYTGFGQHVFHFTPLSMTNIGVIAGIVVFYFGATELVKYSYYRRVNGK
jgi:Mg2+-importing ATPase